RRARGNGAEAEARRRGALRQAREAPLPPRDEAVALPGRQGSAGLHMARGPPAAPARRPCGRGSAPLALLRARRLDALRLARHLRKIRRVRSLARSLRLLALNPLEQLAQVADRVVDSGLDV